VERYELSQSEGLVGEVERETAVPSPDAQAEVPVSREPLPPQGPTPTVIDLTSDDSPSDKGKQKVDVEMLDASDRPGTSAALDGDVAEAFAGWPDFAGLALVRSKKKLPRWGRPTLEFRDMANPDIEPFFTLDDKNEVQHWEYVEGLCKHSMQSLRMVTDTLV
jgi:hypothetical protein